jgi:hypothetical protein
MSTGTTPFWPNLEHWSVKIPLDTPHPRSKALAETGFVMLKPMPVEVPSHEWESLEYMDWKSGGDTNFAPLASADGQLDCRGFWDKGKTDKDALWTSNADMAPTLRDYVTAVGANFGRVRIIKLEPQDRETAIRSIHRDDNNRFNPDDEGWVVRSWVAHGQRCRRTSRSLHRTTCSVASWCAIRGGHPTSVARGGSQREHPALRADHQFRERPGARALDRRRTRRLTTQPRLAATISAMSRMMVLSWKSLGV